MRRNACICNITIINSFILPSIIYLNHYVPIFRPAKKCLSCSIGGGGFVTSLSNEFCWCSGLLSSSLSSSTVNQKRTMQNSVNAGILLQLRNTHVSLLPIFYTFPKMNHRSKINHSSKNHFVHFAAFSASDRP